MKMTKKLLIAAVAVAAVLGLASCQKEVGDLDWKNKGTGDGTQTYTVKQTNEGKSTIRGMKQANSLPRAKATCVVQQFDQTNTSCDGVVGFATFVKTNKIGVAETAENYNTMNFLVVGVRSNCGKSQTYASYYCNIKPDALSTPNFGVADENIYTSYKDDVLKPFEVVIEDLPDGTTKNLNTTLKDGTLKVAIDFVSKTDGTIEINWYDDFTVKDAATQCKFNGDAIKTVKATTTHLGTSTGEKNGYIYVYGNIYAGKTLNAQWDVYNVSWSQAAAYADEIDYIDEDLPLFAGDILFE